MTEDEDPVLLTRGWDWSSASGDVRTVSGAGDVWSVAGAVEEACSDYHEDHVGERAAKRAEANTELLGRLLQTLSDKGLLEPREVAAVVGGAWRVSDDIAKDAGR